jgi:hypothetical protein
MLKKMCFLCKEMPKKRLKNLRNSKIFSNFAIVIKITIATIGGGSEKPKQA